MPIMVSTEMPVTSAFALALPSAGLPAQAHPIRSDCTSSVCTSSPYVAV